MLPMYPAVGFCKPTGIHEYRKVELAMCLETSALELKQGGQYVGPPLGATLTFLRRRYGIKLYTYQCPPALCQSLWSR